MTLVATNVAARGLDINDVQLIIQVCVCMWASVIYFVMHVISSILKLVFVP
jgi:superfamily II DNA/RNA helicase